MVDGHLGQRGQSAQSLARLEPELDSEVVLTLTLNMEAGRVMVHER